MKQNKHKSFTAHAAVFVFLIGFSATWHPNFVWAAADVEGAQEYQIKWIHEFAKTVASGGKQAVPSKPRFAKQWDVNGDGFMDASEVLGMQEFAEDWRIHKLEIVVLTIDRGVDKAHITRKKFLRQWDTNKDWYIDASEIAPVRAELERAQAARAEKKKQKKDENKIAT